MDVKEKLVELLNEVQETGVNEIPTGFCCITEYITNEEVASYLVGHGVTVQEWVSVDDRLPEDSGYYLVVYRDKYNESISIDFDMYVKCNIGEWWESEFACDITNQFRRAIRLQDQEVTHWMPLPSTEGLE